MRQSGTLELGDRVCVHGEGFGKIIGVWPAHYQGDRSGRQFKVELGPTRCRCCGSETNRVKWTREAHVSRA